MNINRGAAKEKQEGTHLSYSKLSRKRPSWMPDIKEKETKRAPSSVPTQLGEK